MARFQLHSLTKPPSAELWKMLALSSLRITEAVRVCDFENRKEPQRKNTPRGPIVTSGGVRPVTVDLVTRPSKASSSSTRMAGPGCVKETT